MHIHIPSCARRIAVVSIPVLFLGVLVSLGTMPGRSSVTPGRVVKGVVSAAGGTLKVPKDAAKNPKGTLPAASSAPSSPFNLGPGIDKQVFLVQTNGQGALTFSLTWTGSAEEVVLTVEPRSSPKKSMTTQGSLPVSPYLALSIPKGNIPSAEDLQQTAEITNALLEHDSERVKGGSPLALTVTLDPQYWKDLQVTIRSLDGEAQAGLTWSGTAQVLGITGGESSLPTLKPLGKVLLPIMLHEFHRSTIGLPTNAKGPLDISAGAAFTSMSSAVQGTWQQAFDAYQRLSQGVKNQMFNPQVATLLSASSDGKLSPSQLEQIGNILRGLLPPRPPHDLEVTVSPIAGSPLKHLRVAWLHADTNEEGFRIERAFRTPGASTAEDLSFVSYRTVEATPTNNFAVEEDVGATPDSWCYRVLAFNAVGDSAPSETICPGYPLSLQNVKYNVKWLDMQCLEESDVDGLSNSDEPYVIFAMVNGRKPDGQPRVWTKVWDDADDVDGGETEPDGGEPAGLRLFGSELIGPEHIDLTAGLTTALFVFEDDMFGNHDDIADSLHSILQSSIAVTQESVSAAVEDIQGNIDELNALMEALMKEFSQMDLYGMITLLRELSEFTGGQQADVYWNIGGDDFVGSAVWPLRYTEAWTLARPPSATGTPAKAFVKSITVDGGSEGKYRLRFCLYPEGASASVVQEKCGIAP